MHAKRTLFNYGKIFVITRPLSSTIPILSLFSQPSCLTLQLTTPSTIRTTLTSSRRVVNRRGIQTRVSPLPRVPFSLSNATIDNAPPCPIVCAHARLVPLLGLAPTPGKRSRGRPKGSKNKKNPAGVAATTSEVAPAAGEKRKRGRPPKVCSAELATSRL